MVHSGRAWSAPSLRAIQPSVELICFGVFELDARSGELRKQGVKVKLQEQPFQVLQVLLEHPQEIVTREVLQQRIWSSDTFVDFDKGLYNAIKKLREALGDDASSPRYIETVPKRGYRFIAQVRRGYSEISGDRPVLVMPVPPEPEAETEDEPVVEPKEAPKTLPVPSRLRTWIIVGSLALPVALASVGFWYWRLHAANRLTAKDTIVLASFINKTGEAVFDDTLEEGLTADLQQSTFLNILSDQKIDEALHYMGLPSDTRFTANVAREVCQRAGSKVSLAGSIATIGSRYVLTLKAVNCENSELLDEEQGEADRRENVLPELHALATRLRSRLGESLPSIQKNNTSLETATTSSLEALQSYSLAMRIFRTQGDAAALPLFQHSIELDPNFAQAYADLSGVYLNMNEYASAKEYAARAHQLRSKVSEWERFSIDSTYYSVTGQLEQEARVLEAWQQTYPNVLTPYVNLGIVDAYLGRNEEALQNHLRGWALEPTSIQLNANLADDYLSLDRLGEARRVLDDAARRKADETLLPERYQLAFLKDDQQAMVRCLNEAAGKPGIEDALLSRQSDTEGFHGRLSRAREYAQRASASALRSGSKETAAAWEADEAMLEAELGDSYDAIQDAKHVLALAPTKEIQIAAAVTMARAGETTQTQSILATLEKSFPEDTLLQRYWLPAIQAAIDLRGNRADQALKSLEVAAPFELGGGTPPFSSGATLYPAYLRGEAYLAGRSWTAAAHEFEKLTNHRGLVWNSPLGALAWLQLGRAYAGSGDAAEAKAAYQKFLLLWRDADPGLTFQAARSEFASLH